MKELSKEHYITQTEHNRITIEVDDDGVRITQTHLLEAEFRHRYQTVYLTKAELAKIIRKALPKNDKILLDLVKAVAQHGSMQLRPRELAAAVKQAAEYLEENK